MQKFRKIYQIHSFFLASEQSTRDFSNKRVRELVNGPILPKANQLTKLLNNMLSSGVGNSSSLVVSHFTVKFHVSTILVKFSITSRTLAKVIAVRQRLVE